MNLEGSSNGISFNYTEVLSEEDEGNVISDGSSLFVKNIGDLHSFPSPDGKVYWGARKWTFAQDKTKADEDMKNIVITSETVNDQAMLIVSAPQDSIPGTRYQVCLVVKAPEGWLTQYDTGIRIGDVGGIKEDKNTNDEDDSGSDEE